MSNLVGIQSIEMRPALAAKGFWSRGGAGFWREVAASAGKSLKDSGDDVNLPPSIGTLQLSTARDLTQLTNENRAEFVKALGEEMAQEIRRLLIVWRTKYHDRAQEFERRLGIYALNAQPAKNASQKACDIAVRYMETIADSIGVMKAELAALLIQVAGDKKVETGWGGGVGNDDPQVIMDAMKRGNVREQISHLDLWIENVLGADVLRKTGEQLKKSYAACRQAGMSVQTLARRRYEVHKKLGISTNENGELSAPVKKTRLIGSKPRNMSMSTSQDQFKGDLTGGFKDAHTPIANTSGKGMDMTVPGWAKELSQSSLPRSEVLAALRDRAKFHDIDLSKVTGSPEEQIATLVGLLGWGSSSLRFKTSQDTLEFEEGGVKHSAGLSEREKRLVANPRDAEKQKNLIPWLQGSLINVVNEEHKWVKEARKRAMPVESAISGTTSRVLNTARAFKFKGQDFPALRLAVLGYLINIKAHSFHEIMGAAQGFPECQYVPGRDAYERVGPLSAEQLRSIAPGGKLPHEHEL
jgi:hypothetical protein